MLTRTGVRVSGLRQHAGNADEIVVRPSAGGFERRRARDAKPNGRHAARQVDQSRLSRRHANAVLAVIT